MKGWGEMNKQGKDGIEWCDYTWNPVTGCKHNCPYCYAAKIYKRFKRSFEPEFHPEKLSEPAKVKEPQKIFVGSTTDLFGEWVPDEWIQEVFKACDAAPHHTYLFLTKNPKRYQRCSLPKGDNYWFGSSVTKESEATLFNYLPAFNHRFISIEPILENLELSEKHNIIFRQVEWFIIGQQTGPGAVPPKPEWVQPIIDQCRVAGVPVFVKSPLLAKFPIREWPDTLI